MIATIARLQAFGVFENFTWPSGAPAFKRYNLLYGWNYSGKTTLSRAFRCFELRRLHQDFPNAQVQLKLADGTVHDYSSSTDTGVFRVFNSDFVRDNLSFDASSATPVLILGAEDIAKQAELATKKADLDTCVQRKAQLESTRKKTTQAIESALTTYARDCIKTPLGEVNYDKRRFEPKVAACRASPASHLLSDEALAENMSIHRSKEKRPELPRMASRLTPLESLRSRVAEALSFAVGESLKLPRLASDAAVEKWVDQGRRLHEETDTCLFCGQVLPEGLMAQLSGHFSAEYEKLMKQLGVLANDVESARKESVTLHEVSQLYPELQQSYTTERDVLRLLLAARSSMLSHLAEALQQKQTQAFTAISCPDVLDNGAEIESATARADLIVQEHNQRTEAFEAKRLEAFGRLEMHHAAHFVQEQKYAERQSELSEASNTIDQLTAQIQKLETRTRDLEQQLSDASRGAERINSLLVAYFGKDDLRIEVTQDKRFQIRRGAGLARNLSEGERTAIAFAYFIASVQDGRFPLSDTRVVIDDPISSLDANHLFNTCALIKTQLNASRQLFVSTHSFEFYNLMREWLDEEEKDKKKPQSQWKHWSVYLVRRTDQGTAALEEIPKELLRFKSEYHYLFALLYRFDKAGVGDVEGLLSLPNVVRRFMEAFGGIMIPVSTGLREKMRRLFVDPTERERVWKFINHYSHQTSVMRSLTIPDTSECKAVVRACLAAVQTWNAQYFKDLENEVV